MVSLLINLLLIDRGTVALPGAVGPTELSPARPEEHQNITRAG